MGNRGDWDAEGGGYARRVKGGRLIIAHKGWGVTTENGGGYGICAVTDFADTRNG